MRLCKLAFALGIGLFCVLSAIAQKPHDLSLLNGTDNSSQSCIYCHTPLGQTGSNPPPDWNPLRTDASFGTIGITVFSQSQPDTIGSVSVACLSCHDGAQAPDVGTPIPSAGLNTATVTRSAHVSISDSHPVSVPYAQGDRNLLGPDSANKPPKRPKRLVPFQRPQRTLINNTPVWWVETGLAGRQKDDVQLYTRREPPSDDPLPYVECASCHDPHGSNAQLLRVPNAGSRLCRACHDI